VDQSALMGDTWAQSGTDQVLILDPTGKVIAVTSMTENTREETALEKDGASGLLANLNNQLAGLGSLSGQAPGADVIGVYDFTASVPSGDGRYGIKIGQGSTVWFTEAQMDKGPGLLCQ